MDSPALRPLAEVIAGRRRLIEEKRRLREQCNIACANRHAAVLRVRAALVQSSSLAKTYNALMAALMLCVRKLGGDVTLTLAGVEDEQFCLRWSVAENKKDLRLSEVPIGEREECEN